MTVERRMEDMPARTAAGVLNKLQVASVWIDTNQGSEDKMGVTERLTLSALGDLERLTGQGFVAVPEDEDPVIALKREWNTRWERYKNEPNRSDEEIIGPLHDRLNEAEVTIHRTPATTPEGIAIKLRMWGRNHPDPDRGENWCEPPVEDIEGNLDDMPILSVLRDLEHLVDATAVAETPAAAAAPLIQAKPSDLDRS